MALTKVGPFVLTDDELDDRMTRFESVDNDEIPGISCFELAEIVSHLLHTGTYSQYAPGYTVICLESLLSGLFTEDGYVYDSLDDDGLASLASEHPIKAGPNFQFE
jgi:hypothetical protein